MRNVAPCGARTSTSPGRASLQATSLRSDRGVLHSRVHELWARATGSQVRDAESGFQYTPTTCFETFPFPRPIEEQREDIGVIGASMLVGDPITIEAVCRDPADDYLLALAKTHGAAIVSGDGDLLALREKTSVRILTAREYLELV